MFLVRHERFVEVFATVKIAHLINPVRVQPSSDLFVAQPVTFESIRLARQHAAGSCEVRLLSAQYPEDRGIVPDFFELTPDLDRSSQDLKAFERPRKLPLVDDLLERLVTATPDADLLVFTNVDIALMPTFYESVMQIYGSGVDGFIINRRTISSRWSEPRDLPLMYAQVGDPHPGRDCFIFTPSACAQFDLGNVLVGADMGRMILWNMALASRRFEWFKDLHLTFHLGDEAAWRRPDYVDYHEHNSREGRAILERLEEQHGPLRDLSPFAETLPRPEGYWTTWRRYIEGDLTPYERIRGRLGSIRNRILRRKT